jgi:ribosomal protein S8
MHITDPVADMHTRIRNANVVYHELVDMPLSKMRLEIARILKEEGYIATIRRSKIQNSRCHTQTYDELWPAKSG